MNKCLLILCLVVFSLMVCTDLLAQECEYDRLLEQSLDVSGSESLAIAAAAGDLASFRRLEVPETGVSLWTDEKHP